MGPIFFWERERLLFFVAFHGNRLEYANSSRLVEVGNNVLIADGGCKQAFQVHITLPGNLFFVKFPKKKRAQSHEPTVPYVSEW